MSDRAERAIGRRLSGALRVAAAGLFMHPQRTLLALAGVLVGVASVVALMSLGKGVERKALAEFDAIGTQVISVEIVQHPDVLRGRRPPPSGKPERGLSGPRLIDALNALPEVDAATEMRPVSCAGPGSVRDRAAPMTAVEPALQDILRTKLAQGRFLHHLDGHTPWVVLGIHAARRLREQGRPTDPGAALMLCGRAMLIAGVLAPMRLSEAAVPLSLDHGILLSRRAADRIDRTRPTESLLLRLHPRVSPEEFVPVLDDKLARWTGKEVRITTAQKVIELRRRQAATRARFLAALGGISLLVGGLGILNIMLMSVMERRHEIGLRLAIGADDIDVGLQFLLESTLLSSAGGAAGVVAGAAAAAVASALAELPFVMPASAPLAAMGVSLVIGTAAGLYPAIKAARVDPAQTLQAP